MMALSSDLSTMDGRLSISVNQINRRKAENAFCFESAMNIRQYTMTTNHSDYDYYDGRRKSQYLWTMEWMEIECARTIHWIVMGIVIFIWLASLYSQQKFFDFLDKRTERIQPYFLCYKDKQKAHNNNVFIYQRSPQFIFMKCVDSIVWSITRIRKPTINKYDKKNIKLPRFQAIG